MPRKKCNKVDKDKILRMKTIKSRLIKISMKVDNYIYKQKTFNITQAKTFLDEISSYEPQCDGNTQYLQVIEKLTRFMNSIISEKDSIIDSINNKVNNSIEVETTHNKEHEIRNTTLPISEVAYVVRNEYSIPNDNNQCDLPNSSKECAKDLIYSNKNENINMEVVDSVITEHANTNIHKSQTNSTRDILNNAVKTLEITSNGPLDLRKSIYNNSFIYSQGQIISNKTTENKKTLKPVVKVDKPETAIKSEVLQKFNLLKINKAANNQDESNKEQYNKCMNNEYVNSKTNILQDQLLKTQIGTNVEYIQPSESNITLNPQNKTAESSKNDAAMIAEGKPKETLHKNKTKFDISIQNCTQNKNNEDDRKNLPEKPKNKRKTNKQSDMKEKTIEAEKNNAKKVKRVNKSCETTNGKKSKTKQNAKNNINLDLSWFDNIKYIREVDEQEYLTIKH